MLDKPWSATKWKIIDNCSLQLWFTYLSGIEKPPKSIALIFGGLIHRRLARFYKDNIESAESFGKSFWFPWQHAIAGNDLKGKAKKKLQIEVVKSRKRLPDSTYKTFELTFGNHINYENDKVEKFWMYYTIARNLILPLFFDQNQDEKLAYLEHPEQFRIEQRFEFDFRGIPFIGYIDRVRILEGRFELWDFKTDRFPPSIMRLSADPQFTLYSAALREERLEEKALTWYQLRTGEKIPTSRTDKDFDLLEERIQTELELISNGIFHKKPGYKCDRCEYEPTCRTVPVIDDIAVLDSFS